MSFSSEICFYSYLILQSFNTFQLFPLHLLDGVAMWGKMKYKVEDFRADMRSTGAGVGSDAKAWVTSLKTNLKVDSGQLDFSSP